MKVARNEKTMYDDSDLNGAFSAAEQIKNQSSVPKARDYVEDLKGDDYDSLSTSEKVELLESLFVIMKGFVNVGHGLDPVNKLVEEFENSSEEPLLMLDSENAADDEE